LISPVASRERRERDTMVGKRLFIAAVAATALIFTALATSSADEEFWAAVMRELP
jgi:hypothetical protein